MAGLLVVGLVAGLIAGISPCILPVLPVVLVAGATGPSVEGVSSWSRRWRSVMVIVGLVVSFSVITLAGSELLSVLGLPQNFLRNAGLVILGLLGIGLLVPWVADKIERPFLRLQGRQPTGKTSGFVFGLALGTVFVPCAGPVLATITVIGATHHVGLFGVLLTLCFAVGASIPLLIVALAGDQLVERSKALRKRSRLLRPIGGVVLIAMTFAIGFNLTDGLQRAVPGYTTALQQHVESTNFAKKQISAVTGFGRGALAKCGDSATKLQDCGTAPAFKGISNWLNTPDDHGLNLAALRGKVVLIDFWTYSCINCQRTIPHLEAWYRHYQKDGLVIVGVHTPEFAFEHVVSNVLSSTHQFGITYPVAIDNNYATWTAYSNEYWPAEYLIDANSEVRDVHFAEGEYGQTESFIRQLLKSTNPNVQLGAPSDVPDTTPVEPTNYETYIGYDRMQYLDPPTPVANKSAHYAFPSPLPLGAFALSGNWIIKAQEATAVRNAQLELHFQAKHIYLVIAGSGTLQVSVDGNVLQTIKIAGIPRLYALFSSPRLKVGELLLRASTGVQAYDFTFG